MSISVYNFLFHVIPPRKTPQVEQKWTWICLKKTPERKPSKQIQKGGFSNESPEMMSSKCLRLPGAVGTGHLPQPGLFRSAIFDIQILTGLCIFKPLLGVSNFFFFGSFSFLRPFLFRNPQGTCGFWMFLATVLPAVPADFAAPLPPPLPPVPRVRGVAAAPGPRWGRRGSAGRLEGGLFFFYQFICWVLVLVFCFQKTLRFFLADFFFFQTWIRFLWCLIVKLSGAKILPARNTKGDGAVPSLASTESPSFRQHRAWVAAKTVGNRWNRWRSRLVQQWGTLQGGKATDLFLNMFNCWVKNWESRSFGIWSQHNQCVLQIMVKLWVNLWVL